MSDGFKLRIIFGKDQAEWATRWLEFEKELNDLQKKLEALKRQASELAKEKQEIEKNRESIDKNKEALVKAYQSLEHKIGILMAQYPVWTFCNSEDLKRIANNFWKKPENQKKYNGAVFDFTLKENRETLNGQGYNESDFKDAEANLAKRPVLSSIGRLLMECSKH